MPSATSASTITAVDTLCYAISQDVKMSIYYATDRLLTTNPTSSDLCINIIRTVR